MPPLAAYGYARQGGKVVDLIFDLGPVTAARDACDALLKMGVQLRWHMDQDPEKGESWQQRVAGH